MMSYKENLQKCHEYVRALEEERRKIEMFQRELPLSLEIVTQTIESCKQQLSGTTTATATATAMETATTTTTTTECSEQTTSVGLVFEEFIPIKKSCSSARAGGEEEEEEEEDEDNNEINELESHKNSSSKSDWLRSAQLWNQSPDPLAPTTKEDEEEHQKSLTQARKVAVVEVKSNAMETSVTAVADPAPTPAPPAAPGASACSTAERGGCGKKEEGHNRKARRCWSPELHRRFLNSLEQLGGPHVATPKQIRELMKVDGLTNDEVKSHLQKYRLHSTKRPTTSTAGHHHNNNANTQAAEFVVVGGIWVPPNSGEGTATGGAPGVVYAPVARPSQHQPRHQATITSLSTGTHHSDQNGARCNSPATSSSVRAATASPAC